jgi:hypothetical protein
VPTTGGGRSHSPTNHSNKGNKRKDGFPSVGNKPSMDARSSQPLTKGAGVFPTLVESKAKKSPNKYRPLPFLSSSFPFPYHRNQSCC